MKRKIALGHFFALSMVLTLSAVFVPGISQASTTSGTIDSTNRYAWSENAGWIDFGTTAGAVTVTDSALTGYAYGENIGWISLNCSNTSSCGTNPYALVNDGNGNLSGYAWSENTGWINFASTTINSSGVFTGYAYGENIGWIDFTGDHPATTDWRPASVRNASTPTPTPTVTYSSGGGGVSISPAALAALLATTTATTTISVPGCPIGFACTPKPVPGCPLGMTCALSTTTPPIKYFAPPSSMPSEDLTLGSRGSAVTDLQNFLIAQGDLSPNRNTGYFGALTQSALAKYQSANGISPATGYYGPKTRSFMAGNAATNAPASTPIVIPTTPTSTSTVSFSRDLTIGSRGSDVQVLQQYLNNHGFTISSTGTGSPGNESTYFGIKTEQALVKFQQANNISPASGYFGAKTRSYIINNQ